MILRRVYFLCAAILSFCFFAPVLAQEDHYVPPSGVISVATPVNTQGAVPSDSRDVFPPLPLSSVCTKEKILGIWKLLFVFEVPGGGEMRDYMRKPLQYYVFNENNLYGEVKSVLRYIPLREVSFSPFEFASQFVVGKEGMVFFYKRGIATDKLACFISETNTEPFRSGQLLLMPPEGTSKTRMLKVYEKMSLSTEDPKTGDVGGQENADGGIAR